MKEDVEEVNKLKSGSMIEEPEKFLSEIRAKPKLIDLTQPK